MYRVAFNTATDFDGLAIVSVNGKRATHYQRMLGQNPKWAKHLRLLGKTGTVKIDTNKSPKLADKGVQCMLVRYT